MMRSGKRWVSSASQLGVAALSAGLVRRLLWPADKAPLVRDQGLDVDNAPVWHDLGHACCPLQTVRVTRRRMTTMMRRMGTMRARRG